MAKSPQKLPTLDLHGARPEDVFDRLEAFLERENERSSPRARVMPGKGTGKIKECVIDYLKKARYPWQYEKLNNGQINEGVLIVFLE